MLDSSTFFKNHSTRPASLHIQTSDRRLLVYIYCLIKLIVGVTPIPDAMAIRFSLFMAKEESGEMNGPTINAGLCDGVVISDMRSPVHPPR